MNLSPTILGLKAPNMIALGNADAVMVGDGVEAAAGDRSGVGSINCAGAVGRVVDADGGAEYVE